MAQSNGYSNYNRKPNYLYSIISVALVLFLLGFFGLVILHAQYLINTFREKVNILVELEDGTEQRDIDALLDRLAQSAFVKPNSIQYISKEEASESMQDDFGKEFLQLDLPNPFYDLISINVRANYMRPDSLEQVKAIIQEDSFVSDVFYQESLVNDIAENIQKVGYIALGIGLFFIFVAITLIHNTIRLALYSNRFLIKNMELVGASWEFISRPYLLRSMLHGAISGLIAIGALIVVLLWAQRDLPELRNIQDLSSFIALFVLLLMVGILINVFSTYYVVNKYLRMRVDELY